MNVADELQKLQQLHESGAINDDEFAQAKARLLNEPPPVSGGPQGPPISSGPAAPEQQARQWAMFLHLSLLSYFLLAIAGIAAPIVIWQLKKDELPGIDAHGKVVVNWAISAMIYAAICVPLCFILVGFLLLIALGVLMIVFPILGGLKANNGELWRYPLSITFLK